MYIINSELISDLNLDLDLKQTSKGATLASHGGAPPKVGRCPRAMDGTGGSLPATSTRASLEVGLERGEERGMGGREEGERGEGGGGSERGGADTGASAATGGDTMSAGGC